VLRACFGQPFTAPLEITLVRVGKRDLDDDNLAGAFKAVRDGVADWLGINDGSKKLVWKYEQTRGDTAITVRFRQP
jgi:hypothetical protein